ncbi:MAG: hypothetical protein VYE22_22500 [Myxococcota bacterium]|nr:hypothetical protein [Myxococcota bacterium]
MPRLLLLACCLIGCGAPEGGDDGGRAAPDAAAFDAATHDAATHDASSNGDAEVPVADAGPRPASCDDPAAGWLFCEDFEAGDGDWDAWWAETDFIQALGGDDRGRITLDPGAHGGSWAAYLPAAASSGHRGATLDWWDCAGEQASGCALESHDELYFRAWVRFADDHRYVHHFLSVGGSQPDDFWYGGTAGCLPNGELAMGTTVDHREGSHESFFYTYHPEMRCDTRCDRYADVDRICAECAAKGLPTCDAQPQCCWGNHFAPEPPVALPVGRWFCLEMTMRANTPGEHDGEMAYWVDEALAHRETGMMWRTTDRLALNRARLQHYITESDADGHSNRVWFDDVVVSTERIGCGR